MVRVSPSSGRHSLTGYRGEEDSVPPPWSPPPSLPPSLPAAHVDQSDGGIYRLSGILIDKYYTPYEGPNLTN